MKNIGFKNDVYKDMGCIIFRRPSDKTAPGIAVYTYTHDDINKAKKRSVHFTETEDGLTVEEFGYDFHGNVNLAEQYIQLSKEDSLKLETTGKVVIKHGSYNVVNSRCKNLTKS